jgi:CRP-like cAMP-binding protein
MLEQKQTIEGMVRDHPFFLTMDPKHLPMLCAKARLVELARGDLLFQVGEPANRFYLIESGEVSLETRTQSGDNLEIKALGGGDVLGWSWLVPPFCWHLQARALDDTRAILLDGASLLVAAEEDHEFGYALMKRVAQMMAQRLDCLRVRLIQEAEIAGQVPH